MSRLEVVNELHRSARKNFRRRHVIIRSIDDLWQVDLVEMIPYAKFNHGYKYLLTIIDAFSKYAWVKPAKNKNGEHITKLMQIIFNETKRTPTNLQSDHGKEFYNKEFQSLMKTYGINHYSTYSKLKASIIERFNRTLKQRMWKMFSFNGNYKWMENVDKLVQEYNNTVHRTIKMKPNEVNRKNEKQLLRTAFNYNDSQLVRNKFHHGDYVRISKYKTVFDKGYTPNWTTEIFKIINVNRKYPPTYLLEDYQSKPVAGRFYEEELMKVKHPNVYLVEKILKRKNGKVFVKWLGFSETHNSWENEKNLI